MRAIQLAMLVLSIQFGLGLMAVFGSFGNIPYETEIIKVNITSQNVQTDIERQQVSFDIMGNFWNILTWGWIKNFFIPWYYTDNGVRSIIDFIILMLRGLTGIIIGAAFIEFVSNRLGKVI